MNYDDKPDKMPVAHWEYQQNLKKLKVTQEMINALPELLTAAEGLSKNSNFITGSDWWDLLHKAIDKARGKL